MLADLRMSPWYRSVTDTPAVWQASLWESEGIVE